MVTTPDAPDTASIRSGLDWLSAAVTAGEHVDVFTHLSSLREDLDRFECAYLRHLNDTGHSWAVIGSMCGVSKQAAFKRYKRLVK